MNPDLANDLNIKGPLQPNDLMTLQEISDASGYTLATVRTYTHRYEDFPKVWKDAGGTFLYLRTDVLRWLLKHGKVHGWLAGHGQ